MEEVGGTLLECEDEQEEKGKGTQEKKYCEEELNLKVIWGVI